MSWYLFSSPDRGYMVIRIHSNNPGKWFFHCHYDFHSGNGMMMILNEKPKNVSLFNSWKPNRWNEKLQCGSWTHKNVPDHDEELKVPSGKPLETHE